MIDEDKHYCEECGDELNDQEIEYNKDADYELCFPCMKGNRWKKWTDTK